MEEKDKKKRLIESANRTQMSFRFYIHFVANTRK